LDDGVSNRFQKVSKPGRLDDGLVRNGGSTMLVEGAGKTAQPFGYGAFLKRRNGGRFWKLKTNH